MKYMGSKSRFAKAIYSRICELSPRCGRAWVEPFAGGMNMISAVPPDDGPRYANDCNEYLIAMFKELQNGWVPPKTVTRQLYDSCRVFDESAHMIGYVGFNCSYSGKWFGGYAGEVRTSTGKIRNYQEEAFRHMQKQILKLVDVSYSNVSYNDITIPENSIVYCDPPYEGVTGYKTKFNNDEFWVWVRKIAKQHDVFVSEYNAPEDFECVWQNQTQSQMSANGKSGGTKISIEKLFRIKCIDGFR